MTTIHAIIGPVVLGQAAGGEPTDVSDAVVVQSVWDFILKGGPMMIPIGLASMAALAVLVERLATLRRRRVLPPRFVPGLKEILDDDPHDTAAALEYCQADGSPVSRVFAAGIKRLHEPAAVLEKHIEEAGQRVVRSLSKYLRALSVIASITPLMGLLGTIFGMIKAFQTVAATAEALGKTELLAKGIYEAMITTAAGLLVAIPVLIMYHWISAKIDQLVADIDTVTVEFFEEYMEQQRERRPGPRPRRPSPVRDDDEDEEDDTADVAVA